MHVIVDDDNDKIFKIINHRCSWRKVISIYTISILQRVRILQNNKNSYCYYYYYYRGKYATFKFPVAKKNTYMHIYIIYKHTSRLPTINTYITFNKTGICTITLKKRNRNESKITDCEDILYYTDRPYTLTGKDKKENVWKKKPITSVRKRFEAWYVGKRYLFIVPCIAVSYYPYSL